MCRGKPAKNALSVLNKSDKIKGGRDILFVALLLFCFCSVAAVACFFVVRSVCLLLVLAFVAVVCLFLFACSCFFCWYLLLLLFLLLGCRLTAGELHARMHACKPIGISSSFFCICLDSAGFADPRRHLSQQRDLTPA